jgi:hypothetical protein
MDNHLKKEMKDSRNKLPMRRRVSRGPSKDVLQAISAAEEIGRWLPLWFMEGARAGANCADLCEWCEQDIKARREASAKKQPVST